MEKRQQKSIRLSQNFLKSPRLVERLVGAGRFGPTDIVYEIGPGKGIITAELARRVRMVVAIEKDANLVRLLRERFRHRQNVQIVGGDFLSFPIREEDYKIFANIPYNATACIVRKILYERPHPSEAFLVMQKEPAKKFSGRPKETLFSILAKPFFEVRVIYRLKRTDFEPVPDVDSVLLRIGRRPRPLIGTEESEVYSAFVSFGFLRWKRDLRAAYRPIFTYEQWKRLARDLGFQRDACPKQLSFEQWLGLYQWFKSSVSDEKQRALIRAFCRRS